jgi:long-chain acyl-CoA synthetase
MSVILEHIIQHKSDHIAVADEHRAVSYHELFIETNQIAQDLLRIFSGRQIRVLISGNNKADFLLLLLAILKTNAELVLLDPKSSEQEIKDICNCIVLNYYIFEISEVDSGDVDSEIITTANARYCIKMISESEVQPQPEKIYLSSSGSTGKPKIFGFSQEQLLQQFLNVADALKCTNTDKSLCPLTITHSHGLQISFPLILKGGTVHYLEPAHCKPEFIFNYVNQHKITILTGVPFQYNQMLNMDLTAIEPFQSLRFCLCGSAPMSKHLSDSFYKKFGVRLNQAYGLSEIGPICFNLDVTEENYTSTGKVTKEIEYQILDDEGVPVHDGQEGELIVRAAFMCNGYINDKEATNSSFKNSWLYTKDIVKRDKDGNITIIGRKSNFINVSGYKVYPVEIEKVLLSMDGIKEAVVVGIDNEERGQIIKAFVSAFVSVDEESIQNFCKLHLPKYKVPHVIQIEKELKQTSIHKVDLSNYNKGI